MFADLHLHSVCSDGTDTPDELISLAEENGISVIAISDHDTIAAYAHIANTEKTNVRIIPAVEGSTVLGHNYLHV